MQLRKVRERWTPRVKPRQRGNLFIFRADQGEPNEQDSLLRTPALKLNRVENERGKKERDRQKNEGGLKWKGREDNGETIMIRWMKLV